MRLDSYIVPEPVTAEIAIRLLEVMFPCGPFQVTSTPPAVTPISTAAFRVMLQRRVMLDPVNVGGSIRTEGAGTADTESNALQQFAVYDNQCRNDGKLRPHHSHVHAPAGSQWFCSQTPNVYPHKIPGESCQKVVITVWDETRITAYLH